MSKQVQDAYIVAATRTPVGKAPRGVFRNTRPDEMLAHSLRAVLAQAPGVHLKMPLDGMKMILPLFTQAAEVEAGTPVSDAAIDAVFTEWVEPAPVPVR